MNQDEQVYSKQSIFLKYLEENDLLDEDENPLNFYSTNEKENNFIFERNDKRIFAFIFGFFQNKIIKFCKFNYFLIFSSL